MPVVLPSLLAFATSDNLGYLTDKFATKPFSETVKITDINCDEGGVYSEASSTIHFTEFKGESHVVDFPYGYCAARDNFKSLTRKTATFKGRENSFGQVLDQIYS